MRAKGIKVGDASANSSTGNAVRGDSRQAKRTSTSKANILHTTPLKRKLDTDSPSTEKLIATKYECMGAVYALK